MKITPVLGAFLGAVPAVLMALFSGGLEGDILVALFLFPMQVVRGGRFGARIMGSSVGVHPLLVLYATLRETPLFERWQKVSVLEVVVEKAPRVAAFGEEPGGLRGCAVGGEG